MLDAGRGFCVLFADRDNPTANGIYRAIGYEEVADVLMIDLGAPPAR